MAISVLVVGGGISGLVAAYRLLQSKPDLDLELVEGEGRLGGTMGSETVDGFLFERGPNAFQGVPETVELARELGLEERLVESSPAARNRCVLAGGRLHAVGPRAILFSSLLSWRGRLRLLTEPFVRRGAADGDESVAAFARRRLGAETVASLIDPIATGVYAGDVEKLSLRSAFPRLAAMEREHGSLLRGVLRSRGARTRLLSFRGGFEDLVGALGRRLGERVRLGAAAGGIERLGGVYRVSFADGTRRDARALLLALPAPRAAALCAGLSGELAAALASIPYAPVAVVSLAYRRSAVGHPLDGFGFLAPRREGLRLLGAIWTSSIFPVHAPEWGVNLRALVGGAHDPGAAALPPADLEALIAAELGPLLALEGPPLAIRVHRYALGIPQYNLGHEARVVRTDACRRGFPGLFLAGNAYRGVGVNDCVREGGRVAREVLAWLESA